METKGAPVMTECYDEFYLSRREVQRKGGKVKRGAM